MPLFTLTSKGQITIPIRIRKSLSISAGDKIEFIINEQNEVVIKPITKKAIDVFGQLRKYKNDRPISIEEIKKTIATQFEKDFS